MFHDEVRHAIETAPRSRLPDVAAVMWRAFGEGQISETDAEALSALIEARKALAAPPAAPRKPVGSRPRTDASMERRRRWAASGRLPPGIAARFTLAEQAVLAVIAVETVKRGDCRFCHEHVAAAAGVSRSTVKTALRQAKVLGLVTIEERRLARFRNDTNVVCIVSREWIIWLRLARSSDQGIAFRSGGGVKFTTRTNTPVSYPVNSEGWRPRKGYREVVGDLNRQILSKALAKT